MAELKTKKTGASVSAFLGGIEDEAKRADAKKVAALMKKVTGASPKMWGPSMVGFGSYHYKYESGREGDWMLTGFSPRKQSLTIYIMDGFRGREGLMKKLGKHRTGKSCLYVRRLQDVDMAVLEELVERSVAHLREKYPTKN